jgi:hypothetical protein
MRLVKQEKTPERLVAATFSGFVKVRSLSVGILEGHTPVL